MKKRHLQKLVLVSVFLLMAFNAPLLLLFNVSDEFLGFPVVLFYVFSIWFASALISFTIIRKYNE
ncbi:MAG: hypothetical protein CFE23_15855 [Flavobacterium sp. BFFFF1]|uniref:hypothetical protein n=1 Tax=Flavobacterium sp. BFFFF1 TaxID=2015557 RepID=UPI000BD7B332|nr:hypothetical protein [Flavobacterium sp. BFFFF1]OYU79049.1 MAG: hypothetical protein CFE23_15855 [Flavobacterium sp. BFFFF1]